MSVNIGNDTKIGDNNAIGDNAKVNLKNVNQINSNEVNIKDETDTEKRIWFARHPWLSGILCSLIATAIVWLLTKLF